MRETPPVHVATAEPAPSRPSEIFADTSAVAVQHPAADLRPPPALPLLSLHRQGWESEPPGPDYLVELDADGRGVFVGASDVCVKGEVSFQVPGATVEEAKRLVRASHVFDHPLLPCERCCWTDVPPLLIQFWEGPPGRTVRDSECPDERRSLWKLAAALDELLEVRRWVGTGHGHCGH